MLSTLPSFIMYVVSAVSLFVAAMYVYKWTTPYDELELIKQNNIAAAVAFSGAMLGFAAPLASVIAHSASLLDVFVWAVLALAVQLAVWKVVDFIVGKQLQDRIESNKVSTGILLGAASLSVGILNAACLTY